MAVLLTMIVATLSAEEYELRKPLAAGSSVTTPREAVSLALADVLTLDHDAQRLARYVWVPDWFDAGNGFAQVSLVANSTFSRTSNLIQPTALCGGKLLRLDLDKFAAQHEQIIEVVNLYELLRQQDSYFNTEVALQPEVAVVVESAAKPPEPQPGDEVEMLANGKWAKGKLVSRDGEAWKVEQLGRTYVPTADQVRWHGQLGSALGKPTATEVVPQSTPQHRTTFAAAAYLFPEGAKLFAATHSDVPIMRLDEWVAFAFSSVNGGHYYQLTGIEKNLEATIKKFAGGDAAAKVVKFSETMRRAQAESQTNREPIAANASRLDPELAKTKAYIQASGVTGRQRLVLFINGAATAPAIGPQTIAITFDISEDNLDPASDPLRGPTRFEKYDGGEAIFVLPNGLLAYVVFNAKDEIIASVPDNVAHDFAARDVRANVATTRVFAGVSCANCHDRKAGNWGWQPVTNDLYDSLRGLGRLVDDRGQADPLRAQQIAASQFGADDHAIRDVLSQARLSYQHRAQLATNHSSTHETVAGLADSYWGYWYDQVTPQIAVRELGKELDANEAQLFLLRGIDPEATHDTILREDAVLARLKSGNAVAPAQWRSIFQSAAERLLFKPETVKPQPAEAK